MAPIMVIDDDADLRESVCEILSDEGYRVESHGSAMDALTSLRNGSRPALILLDLMMPMMNGWEFRKEQLKDPCLNQIPVVVLTASRNLHDHPIEASQILLKPPSLDDLLAVVRRHI